MLNIYDLIFHTLSTLAKSGHTILPSISNRIKSITDSMLLLYLIPVASPNAITPRIPTQKRNAFTQGVSRCVYNFSIVGLFIL